MNCIRHNCEKSQCLEKARTANSAEELLEMAKAENIEISAEEAAKAFAELNKTGELSDEELDNVAGGCAGPYQSGDTPLFNSGDRVKYRKKYVMRIAETLVLMNTKTESIPFLTIAKRTESSSTG